jgi:hypothetical protein
MKLKVAEKITDDPDKYPGYLIAFAEGKLRTHLARTLKPVAQIAKKEGWF